jgi:purine-binding chemotaxis protein CheW
LSAIEHALTGGRPGASRQYATFYVAGQYFGIDVTEVQEVLRSQETTGVPLAPPVIRGLINLRGQIVTAIDMRRRLRIESAIEAERKPMNLVVRSDDGPVSLLVDEIGDVIEVGADRFEAPPDSMSAVHKQVMDGVYKLENCLLVVLNRERVLQV